MAFRIGVFATLIFSPFGLLSQQLVSHTIKWIKPAYEEVSGKGKLKFLQAEGLINNPESGFLPEFYLSQPIAANVSKVSVQVVSADWEDMVGEEASGFEGVDNVTSAFAVTSHISIEKRNHYAVAKIPPVIKENGRFKKLKSISIKFTPASYSAKASFVPQYSASSVLASGSWFKMGVTADGVYKINRNLLQQMGIDPGSVNPKNIRIYGNGGGLIPRANNEFRYDDLQENSILVSGENDGSFDSDDYILFYGQSPNRWKQNPNSPSCIGDFYHITHDFSDTTYYFITADKGAGKRISNQISRSEAATHSVTTFNDYAVHEKDAVNLIKSGKDWLGEVFDITLSYDFPFSFPNLDNSRPTVISARYVARSVGSAGTTFSMTANGSQIQTVTIPKVTGSGTDIFAKADVECSQFNPGADNINLTVSYNKGANSEAQGWLDYIECNVHRKLIQSGSQMNFRDKSSVGPGNIAEYSLQNANGITIWDVTNPIQVLNQLYSPNGNSAVFRASSDVLHEFISFTGSSFLSPTIIGNVPNQNLHGTANVGMIIVAPNAWNSEAERLANFHRNNPENPLTVQVVSPEQIYNEFSSGTRDMSAIRDYARMYYDRGANSNHSIKYLCLFGDGSYDNKARFSANTAFIPTYESYESLNPTTSYVCDDYYALLDSSEGNFNDKDVMDIGVGRLPVKTLAEAKGVVDKIIGYSKLSPTVATGSTTDCCSGGGTNTAILAPDWRNIVCFIADDEDNNLHMSQSSQLSAMVDTLFPWLNIDKIYLDAYQQISTPGGTRYPEVNKAINNRCEKGVLMMNYTGHGGEVGIAHERIWMVEDILSLKNINSLPAFVTATCEFSRWDDPQRTSAGEYVLLNPDGGGIALFTTSRLVYSAPNFTLNQNFLKVVFDTINGQLPAMGEVLRYAKSPKLQGGIITNSRNFSLLGDPAQRLAYPKNVANLAKINNVTVDISPDTISALSLITVSGNVTDRNGNSLNTYSGTLYPTVFDKPSTITTLSNDGGYPFVYKLQKNVLYKGKATIANGLWSFQFVVPKDIAYNYGFGRMSFYAQNDNTDATGFYENFIVGGSNPNAPTDVSGPVVKLFMNNDKFVFGGTTNENPLMLAFMTDSNGINTVGNGIGHDITAILDQNTSEQMVLNDYYQADLNSYKSGSMKYNLSNISDGRHTLSLKVWDVYNNSSETYTEFVVATNAAMALKHVLNYPNPFTTHTSFMFEHNQVCTNLEVHIQVMTISGKVVKNIHETVFTQGFRIDKDEITWDGRDDYGSAIGKGVYVYRINVRNPEGSSSSQFERLVILN